MKLETYNWKEVIKTTNKLLARLNWQKLSLVILLLGNQKLRIIRMFNVQEAYI